MNSSHIEALALKSRLYRELDNLLDCAPGDVDERLADESLKDEPELLELLGQLKNIALKYSDLSAALNDRLTVATWDHLFAYHGIAKGDVIEMTYNGKSGSRFIVTEAIPSPYSDPGVFHVSGPSCLATGKPGKRIHTIVTGHSGWRKVDKTLPPVN